MSRRLFIGPIFLAFHSDVFAWRPRFDFHGGNGVWDVWWLWFELAYISRDLRP